MKLLAIAIASSSLLASGFSPVEQAQAPSSNNAQIVEVRRSDVVQIPPRVKHWHGATATTAMTHIALQEQLDGQKCGLDGTGQRRAISQAIAVTEIFGSRDARSWLYYTAIDRENLDKDFSNQQHKE